MSCENEGRDWNHTSISQRTPKIARKPPQVGEKPGTDPPPTVLRRNRFCQHLGLGLLACRTVRQNISVS